MSENPRVTVVVPMYNAEAFVAECIESVRGQTIDDWEMLIVDDGSTDASANSSASVAIRPG